MSSFDLNIDLGIAFGKHKINMVVEHTGLGYLIFICKMPFHKEERREVPVSIDLIHDIDDFREVLANYNLFGREMQRYGFTTTENIQLEIGKLPILRNLNISFKNISFNIKELIKALTDIYFAARVEYTRSSTSVENW